MLSKTLFFNKTLFKKNMARFWPMWGMVSFIGILIPAALLLNLGQHSIQPHDLTQLYYQALVFVIPIVSLVYAILCALACWEYLFFPRNLSMMHTIPIKREGIFVTNFLSGAAMMFIPYAVTGLMCVIVSVFFGCFDLLPLLKTIVGVAGMSFFYFSSATFVAFLTGNIFMLPPLYFLLHFLAPLMDFLCTTYAGQFIYGLNSSYSGKVDFLSPTVYLMKTMEVHSVYEEMPDPDFPTNLMSVLVDFELHGMWIIGVYALVGVVLLAGAWLLYSRRRSECAGDVMAVRHLKPAFRFGIAALAALTGGLLLYMLLWNPLNYHLLMAPLPLAVCMVVAGAIGYYAASMMLAKSLRVFRGSWKGLSLVAIFSAVLCFSLSADVLGIGSRVPAMENIQSLTFRAADNSYTFEAENFEANPGEAALLEQVLAIHAAIAADSDYIVDFIDRANNGRANIPLDKDGHWDYSDISPYNSVRFTYILKDGTRVERRYNNVPITRERLAQPNTYDAKLDALINSNEMRCKRLFMDCPEYEPYRGDVWMDFGSNNNFSLNDRETAALLEAVRKDAMAGTWGTYQWFEDNYQARYAMSIDLNLRHHFADDDRYGHEYLNINVYPGMEHTIAALIDLGIVVSEDDMMTYAEVDFQNFAKLMKEKVGKAPHEMTKAELQKYCDEYGYDYGSILEHLYGPEVLTSFPNTMTSTPYVVVEATDAYVNMNPNSSSIYIS